MADDSRSGDRGLDAVADLRVTYDEGTLETTDLSADPLTQFGAWFTDAVAAPGIDGKPGRAGEFAHGAAEGSGLAGAFLLYEPRLTQVAGPSG